MGELLGFNALSLYSPLYSTAKWESVYIEKIEIGIGNGDWSFLELKMELMDLPHNFNTTLTPTTKSDLENGSLKSISPSHSPETQPSLFQNHG